MPIQFPLTISFLATVVSDAEIYQKVVTPKKVDNHKSTTILGDHHVESCFSQIHHNFYWMLHHRSFMALLHRLLVEFLQRCVAIVARANSVSTGPSIGHSVRKSDRYTMLVKHEVRSFTA